MSVFTGGGSFFGGDEASTKDTGNGAGTDLFGAVAALSGRFGQIPPVLPVAGPGEGRAQPAGAVGAVQESASGDPCRPAQREKMAAGRKIGGI